MFCVKHNAQEGLPQIRFLNVKPNDSFDYSIVLVRGEILNYTHRRHRHGLSSVQIVNENIEGSIESAEIASDGKFKVAVELAPGVNQLKFRFCCATHGISLIFDKRKNPRYLLRILYIICSNHDGHFQAPCDAETTVERACEKIDLAIRLVQCLYAEMLTKHGFDRKSFEFIGCKPFHSSISVEEARQWDQNQLWQHHAKEILAQESTEHRFKYFGILASTLCENGMVKGHAALGIGDVALFGSGTLYAWPTNFATIQRCFQDETPVDTNQLMDDSNGKNTYGGCFATALGSICHEIGHIFDLGHTTDGIMGNDIDYVNRIFTVENCPRDLPRRMASKCASDRNADDKLNQSNRRLTTIRKTNSILTNYHCRRNDDLTFLTENCAILLNSHKWFNQFAEHANESCIRCDIQQKIIKSSLPLVLVEFRSKQNGMCMKYYRFDVTTSTPTMTSNVSSLRFTIPSDVIEQNYDLIAVDKNGNIMKC
ncbi:uncharacterized protein LOC129569064 [Sitodiplosis mosellana]|uniref:uncharacterized protein LOC129569064 n=1 Tax=Sitodiplosis mosellana TaxID=263140 RepID=UPI002444C049|nr:uncharacterized protein LOC129569064 [Sitodiplosis mosellana]